jgi:hypothetical protein
MTYRVTVEMTPEQVESYCNTVGVDRSELRSDLESYIRTALQDAPDFTGGGADVSVRS